MTDERLDQKDIIDLKDARKRIRVPSSRRMVTCPKCNLHFNIREQESHELEVARLGEKGADKRIAELEEALLTIYAIRGEDEQIAKIIEEVSL